MDVLLLTATLHVENARNTSYEKPPDDQPISILPSSLTMAALIYSVIMFAATIVYVPILACRILPCIDDPDECCSVVPCLGHDDFEDTCGVNAPISAGTIFWVSTVGCLPTWLILSCLIFPSSWGTAWIWHMRDIGDILTILLICRAIRFCNYKSHLRATFFYVVLAFQYALASALIFLTAFSALPPINIREVAATNNMSFIFRCIYLLSCSVSLFTIFRTERSLGGNSTSLRGFRWSNIILYFHILSDCMVSGILLSCAKYPEGARGWPTAWMHIALIVYTITTILWYSSIAVVSLTAEQMTRPDYIELAGRMWGQRGSSRDSDDLDNHSDEEEPLL